jgi:hypothetical protein
VTHFERDFPNRANRSVDFGTDNGHIGFPLEVELARVICDCIHVAVMLLKGFEIVAIVCILHEEKIDRVARLALRRIRAIYAVDQSVDCHLQILYAWFNIVDIDHVPLVRHVAVHGKYVTL